MRPEQLPIIDLQPICLVCHLKWRKYPGDKLLQKVATYCTEADFFDVFFKSKKIKSVKKRDKIKNTSPPLFYQIDIAPVGRPCIFQRNYHYYLEIAEAKSYKNLLYELTKLSKKRFIQFRCKSWILPYQRVTSIRLHLATNRRSTTSLDAVFSCLFF